MTPKDEALAYLAQVAQDYIKQLPPSAGLAVAEKAQAAINVLVKEQGNDGVGTADVREDSQSGSTLTESCPTP